MTSREKIIRIAARSGILWSRQPVSMFDRIRAEKARKDEAEKWSPEKTR